MWRASGGRAVGGRVGAAAFRQWLCFVWESSRQVLLTLDVVFRGRRVHVFTCFGLVLGVLWFGASLRAGTCLVVASGRLAGMRGPATRLKRDVRPVLGVMSDGRRVCVRNEGSVCYRENIVWCRRCMSEKQRKARPQDSTVSQQKSPPPDSLVAFKGRCPAAVSLHLLLPRGVSAVRVPPSRLPCPLIGRALYAVLPQVYVYKALILHITSCLL